MLKTLSIRDFVIVDRLELEFRPGFTVLTGETGAGKSILIDALSTVLGERADPGLVRQGCEKAEVSATFSMEDAAAVRAYLADNDLAEDEDCLLRRVIDSAGRSRGYVNGRPATVQQLREIGEFLVDIHGQHAHQSLMRPAGQREILDGFAGAAAQAKAVAEAWRAWQTARQARSAAEADAAAIEKERERLSWQTRELDALAFRPDEWDELQVEHKRLAHAASLIEGVELALEMISEGEGATTSTLAAIVSRLNTLAEYDTALKEAVDILEPAQVQVQEAVYALRRYRQRLELDPQRLREVESRLEAVHTAARKYRTSPELLPSVLDQAKTRLGELDASLDPQALARREQGARQAYLAAAGALTAARTEAAKTMSRKVTDAMQALGMQGGAFQIALTALEEGAAYGTEQVEFLVAGHAGTAPRPLVKVASGGELSRVSLAIQTASNEAARVPTLIFDEVDAGIGGGVAEIVGRMLRGLGRRNQVMCVTHLPQVAACADQQWRVAKRSVSGKPLSSVRALDEQARIEEIARMLGGVTVTDTSRRHAAEMLGLAPGHAKAR